MAIQNLIETLAERLGAAANVKSVYGEPITAGGRTVIPVAVVAYGFGGGTGKGKRPGNDDSPEGGGAGGGMRAQPAGVLEITPEGTRFIGLHPWRPLAAAALAGFVFGALLARRQ
jgi:uncharacterized spore protein YtfJ